PARRCSRAPVGHGRSVRIRPGRLRGRTPRRSGRDPSSHDRRRARMERRRGQGQAAADFRSHRSRGPLGLGTAPQAFAAPVRIVRVAAERLSIFPLPGAILFPGLQLPLHIFEPRYRALVSDALVRDRRIAMIQPQGGAEGAPLFGIGCVGRIDEVEALDDGRYNIVLDGEARFRLLREIEVSTPYRQVEGELLRDPDDEVLSSAERAGFGREALRFASAQGYSVDWESVERLDDALLING